MNFRLHRFWTILRSIHSGAQNVDQEDSIGYLLPRSLVPAFQALVMMFVAAGSQLTAETAQESQLLTFMFDDTFAKCEQYLVDGRSEFMQMIHTNDYEEHAVYEAVGPAAIVTLMIRNLLNSSLDKSKFHVTDIYSEYTVKMVRNSLAYIRPTLSLLKGSAEISLLLPFRVNSSPNAPCITYPFLLLTR